MGSRRQVTRTADALIAARPASGARRPSPRWGGDGGRGRRSARMGVGKGGTGARAPTHPPASPAWAWRAPAGPPLCHHRPPLSLLPRSSTPLPAHAGTYIHTVRTSLHLPDPACVRVRLFSLATARSPPPRLAPLRRAGGNPPGPLAHRRPPPRRAGRSAAANGRGGALRPRPRAVAA